MTLSLTQLTDAQLPQATAMNLEYTEVEAVVNAADRDNLETKHTVTMVTSVWEDLNGRENSQVHKVMVPRFITDTPSYLVGFSFNVVNGGSNDIRLTLLRGNLIDGDKDTIEDMAIYRTSTDGTRDTVTEAFLVNDYVSVNVTEQDMTSLGGDTPPANYTAGIVHFEIHLFFAHPILSAVEL